MNEQLFTILLKIKMVANNGDQDALVTHAFELSTNKMYFKKDAHCYCTITFYLTSNRYYSIKPEFHAYNVVFDEHDNEKVIESYLDEAVALDAVHFDSGGENGATSFFNQPCYFEDHAEVEAMRDAFHLKNAVQRLDWVETFYDEKISLDILDLNAQIGNSLWHRISTKYFLTKAETNPYIN